MATNLTPTVGATTRNTVPIAPPNELLLRNGYNTPTMHGLVLTVMTTGHRPGEVGSAPKGAYQK